MAIPVVEYLIAKHRLKTVLTGPDKPTGRGRTLTPNEFAEYCASRELRVLKPSNDLELESALQDIQPDLVITAAYGRLVKPHQLLMPKKGWLNIHFSLLPRWRGAAPVQFSILNGDTISGVTVFKLDSGLDTGPIYASQKYEMNGKETSSELLEVLSQLALKPLEESITKIENGVEPIPQSSMDATVAPKIRKADGRVDWSEPASLIERKVRAFYPWPGCWSRINGIQLTILEAACSKSDIVNDLPTGGVIVGNEVFVKCGDGFLVLNRVKPEGKREMSAKEWIRGIQNKENLCFEISEI